MVTKEELDRFLDYIKRRSAETGESEQQIIDELKTVIDGWDDREAEKQRQIDQIVSLNQIEIEKTPKITMTRNYSFDS